MPDRMPEDMSDRMPEDLPVRKCINVMVGITRSKVIVVYLDWGHGLFKFARVDLNLVCVSSACVQVLFRVCLEFA
jgi:hypothetical protein